MKTTRRSFIKGLLGTLAALKLGRRETVEAKQELGDWELVAVDGRPGPHATSPLGGNSSGYTSTNQSRSPWAKSDCEDECANCKYDNCLDYCLNDGLDDEYLAHLQEQMDQAARQETEREFGVHRFQQKISTDGAEVDTGLGLDALRSCSPAFMLMCYPDGTTEWMEG